MQISNDERIRQALQDGDAVGAEHACRQWLQARPDDESALLWLAIAQQQQGQLVQALAIHRRLTRLYPGNAMHWNNLGTLLRAQGLLADAEQAYLAALRLDPDDSVIKGSLGLLCMERGEPARARDLLLDAALHQPAELALRIHAVMACYECGDTLAVEHLLADWRDWPELDEDLRVDLASVLAQLGHTKDAEFLLDKTRTLTGERSLTLARLVLLYERVNRLDEARELLARLPDPQTLAEGGEREEVTAAICTMAVRGPDPAATRTLLERLIAQMTGRRQHGNLYFALAKTCDKLGDTEGALQALAHAHEVQLETAAQLEPGLLEPGVQPLAPALIRMTAAEVAGWSSTKPVTPVRSPIFVVGFPRSGTTLLEQMLDAHPALASMDERPFIQELAEQVQGWGLLYPEALGQLDESRCEALRQAYWEMAGHVVQLKPGQRLVDKNPLSLLHLPLIKRLFPDARVILALRHPCDVILSCYMQNFRSPGFQIMCSSLERLAHGYVNGMEFVIHHGPLLGLQMLYLRYEDLLDDFDATVERIGAFIEVDDAAPLRDFHQHAQQKGFISTPSYSQVTQPPNKNAMGRWRRYESAFIPLLPILKDVMEHWGYDR